MGWDGTGWDGSREAHSTSLRTQLSTSRTWLPMSQTRFEKYGDADLSPMYCSIDGSSTARSTSAEVKWVQRPRSRRAQKSMGTTTPRSASAEVTGCNDPHDDQISNQINAECHEQPSCKTYMCAVNAKYRKCIYYLRMTYLGHSWPIVLTGTALTLCTKLFEIKFRQI